MAEFKKMTQNVGIMYRLLKDRHVPKKAKFLIHMTILRPILLYKEAEEQDHCCRYESPEISNGSNQNRESSKCRYMKNLRPNQSLRPYRQTN